MTRFFYLLVRFIEFLLVGLVASAMIVISGGMIFLTLSSGASIEKVALLALVGVLTCLVAVWIFLRRFRISGRDELFAQTGIDLSEGNYVAFVLVAVIIFIGFAAWIFIDDDRIPKISQEGLSAVTTATKTPTD
jgi:uncharacterized membrane protein YhaH (DUF805 family)